MSLGGQTVVNNGNGHDSRATAVTVGEAGGPVVFDWLSNMFKQKLAQAVPDGSYNNLLAIGNQVAPMTIDSSSSLGTVTQILLHGTTTWSSRSPRCRGYFRPRAPVVRYRRAVVFTWFTVRRPHGSTARGSS